MSEFTRQPLSEAAQAKLAEKAPRLAPAAARQKPDGRQPFGSMEQKMAHPPIPGFYIYWFNDEPGRLERAKKAGYEHVTDENGLPVSTVAGAAKGGGSLMAFLMKLPQEWADQDRQANEDVYLRRMAEIKRGRGPGTPSGRDGAAQYIPSQGIAITEERR